MRGFRFIGPISIASTADYNPGDLLFVSPSDEGGDWRQAGIRARDFDMFSCQVAVATGRLADDYVFVPTALGETAFVADPEHEFFNGWR